MNKRFTLPVAVAAALAMAPLAGGASAAPAGSQDGSSAAERFALRHGIQTAPKGSADLKGSIRSANPYVGMPPKESSIDFATWREQMKKAGAERSASSRLAQVRKAAGVIPTPFVYDEQEIVRSNSNDSQDEAERISAFGTAQGKKNAVRILGDLDAFTQRTSTLAPAPEDNGSIPLAADSTLDPQETVTTTGVIGDGPHGSSGDGTGDFDFYKIEATAGERLTVDTGATSLDTVVGIYDAAGTLLAVDDDSGPGLSSYLTYDVSAAGTYYAIITTYKAGGPFPNDPMDSGSGNGVGREGNYGLSLSRTKVDRDFYAVWLRPGDVLGGVARKGTANELTVYRPDGTEMVGGQYTDASSLYPPESPLPGGGNTTIAYVAEQAGWYGVEVNGDAGAYEVQLEAYRPGGEQATGPVQRIFLDFDGGRFNTGVWGGPGVRDISPFNAWLSRWGLKKSQEAELIRKITTEVNENLKWDAINKGLNPKVQVNIVNSSNSPDIYGQPRTSRLIIGGSIEESGISTIGIAQYIDPGNYNMSDQAIILLDVLSAPAGPESSLNTYLKPESDRVAFVSQAVGNVVAHEMGHLIGNYHTDNANEVANLMDAGGAGFAKLFGVGPDGVGGTADDIDTDFTTDTYRPTEGFTGLENTLNVTSWAFTKR